MTEDSEFTKSATDTQLASKQKHIGSGDVSHTDEPKSILQLMQDDPLGPHGYNLLALGSAEIGGHLESVWGDIQTSAVYLLGGPQENRTRPATFIENPQPELMTLYARLFGDEWRTHTALLARTKAMTTNCLLEGIIAAAAYEWVYRAPSSWDSPEQLLKKMQARHQLLSFNKYFEFIGKPQASIEEAAWWAGREQASDPDFKEHVLRPIAVDVAKKLWNVLQPQLAVLGLREVTWEKAKQDYHRRLKMFTAIFTEALVLKAKIKAAPGTFSSIWTKPGTKFDRTRMEDLQEDGGDRKVLWCVSPGITFRDPRTERSQSYCDAKVFTRKLRAKA